MYVASVGGLNRKNSDVFNYIEGTDIFNSKFIFEMNKYTGNLYRITSSEGRLDLISKDSLGSLANYGINYIHNRITDNEVLKIGKLVELLSDNDISIIKTLL